MLQFLGRRWWGVSGWTFLLSLTLASVLYWLLPVSHAAHRWTFEGTVRFEGFTRDHQRLVVSNTRSGGTMFHYQSLMKEPPSLMFNTTGFLLVKSDGQKRQIHCTLDHVSFAIRDPKSSLSSYGGKYLLQSREAALSDNESWLIMTRQYPTPWRQALQWLQKTLTWSPSVLSEGWSYSAVIIDLNMNKEIVCPLQTYCLPRYFIHPEGLGVAVLDERIEGTTFTKQTQFSNGTLTWYTLPLGQAHHSFLHWCLILAAFGLPVGLSMLWNLLRRKRRMPVDLPTHP